MNAILEKNLNSLKEFDVEMKEYFNNREWLTQKQESNLQVGIEIIEDKKVLYMIKDGKQYQLDSLYDNTELLTQWYDQVKQTNYRSRYLLFGLGNGMFVHKLLEEVGEETLILIVEPSKEIFTKVMEEFDLSKILSSKQTLLLVNGISKNEVNAMFKVTLGYEDFAGVIERTYLNYSVLFPKELAEYKQTLGRFVQRIYANELTACFMGQACFDNSLANAPYLVTGKLLSAVKQSLPKGIPGIVVAAGPSLDKNIQDLKLAKNKAFILAADSAVTALLKAGIVPDAMITCDARKSGKYFWNPEIQKIPLITRIAASRKLTVLHTGDKYFINVDNHYVKDLFEQLGKELPMIPTGGCVATDAYAVLEYLQFETIIMIGQDLAYEKDRNYAKGTVLSDMKVDTKAEEVVQVEGIYGDMLNTELAYCVYLDWFEKEIAANPNVHAIDATEGGAKIHGSTIMTLKEAIALSCKETVDIQSYMMQSDNQLTEEEQQQVKESMLQIPQKLAAVQKEAEHLIREYEKMWAMIKKKEYTGKELKKLLERASTRVAELEKTPIFFYADLIIQQAVRDELGGDFYAEVDGETEEETAIKQVLGYFKVVRQELKRAIPQSEEWMRAFEDEELRRKLSAEDV